MTKSKLKNRKNVIGELEKKIIVYTNKVDITPTENDIKTLVSLKKKLEIEYDEKAKGAQVRSEAKFVEKGDRNTNYFLAQESGQQKQMCITKLRNSEGQIVCTPEDILHEEMTNYIVASKLQLIL